MPSLHNVDQDILLADHITVCESFPERLRGLLGKRSLRDTEVFWIRPCDSIHTFFMFMPIDVAFINADLKVVKTIPNMTQFRVSMPVRQAAGVLEGPVGILARAKIKRGTQLRFDPTS